MTKTIHRNQSKRRSRAGLPAPRQGVTRREYAEIALRLGSLELQMQRNRTAIDLQAQRINQLQELVNAITTAPPPQAVSPELPALPMTMTTTTIES